MKNRLFFKICNCVFLDKVDSYHFGIAPQIRFFFSESTVYTFYQFLNVKHVHANFVKPFAQGQSLLQYMYQLQKCVVSYVWTFHSSHLGNHE